MKKKKQLINIILLLLFTFLVLFFSLKDNFESIVKEIRHLSFFWLLLSIILVLLNLILKAYSLHAAIQKVNPEYTIKKAVHLSFVTQFFNAITPFSTGGQPFQIYTLKKDGISVTNGTNIIMQNFIVYQIALVLLGLITVLYNSFCPILKNAKILKNLVGFGFLINTVVVVVLFLIAFGKRWNTFLVTKGINILEKLKIVKDKEKTLKNWNTYIVNFHKGAKTLFLDKKLSIKTIIQNFLALLCLYLVPFTLLHGMQFHDISMKESIIASSYTMLIGAFVPIPGGTGGLEYGYLKFFSSFIKGPILNASMLLWRTLTYYLGLITGAIALNIKRK